MNRLLPLDVRGSDLDIHLTLLSLQIPPSGLAPIFTLLTSLHIVFCDNPNSLRDIQHVFPRLKRLAVSARSATLLPLVEFLYAIGLVSLEMTVVVFRPNGGQADELRDAREVWAGSRLYFLESSMDWADQRRAWEAEVRGGESIWDRAVAYTATLSADAVRT
ncbi:hypothetical protein BD626DRAFT_477845 [Schizophyllum amplum]|uniref:Uncharacterized protein n=1 Tax=Schizophyllum amplum TaxID=97359 RepID=A0A550D0I3_9AGAR|nr:hypothetical protein BD626DRAFT_477845 [Auriculariopsis ampla]